MMAVGGLTLQISSIQSKVVLDQFLIEAKVQAIGVLDSSLNNEVYNYVAIADAVSTPWYQSNPIQQIDFVEGHLKITDILLVFPMEAETQQRIQLMPHSEPVIFYLERFAIRANLSMGSDMLLSGVLDSLDKRFVTLTDVSLFPMFPARAALPEKMPIALLNRAKISHYHAADQ
jgi:hypothetical protein